MSRALITLQRLRDRLLYDPLTGVFTNLVQRSPRALRGQVAGSIGGNGRQYLYIDGTHYLQSRLAWFYVHGKWPTGDIDHKNSVVTDNRLTNLRDISHQTNAENQRDAHKDSQSGMLGVSPHQGQFRARICLSGKIRHLGLFPTPTAAHAAYLAAKRESHVGCTI